MLIICKTAPINKRVVMIKYQVKKLSFVLNHTLALGGLLYEGF